MQQPSEYFESSYLTGISAPSFSENIDLSEPNKTTLLAICTDGFRYGVAIYTDSRIQLVADRKDPGDPYKGLDILIQKYDPQVVLVSSVQRKVIVFLEKHFKFHLLDISRKDTVQREREPGPTMFQLAIVPNIWFSNQRGLQKLNQSELVTNQRFKSEEERTLFMASRVKKSVDVCAIRAISAIDQYIIHVFAMKPTDDENNQLTFHGHHSTQHSNLFREIDMRQTQLTNATVDKAIDVCPIMPILDVNYIDPGPILSIDKFTFECLGIFSRKRPSKNEEPPKDDMTLVPTLYELLNQCKSPQGARHLRTIMMWPLQDEIELENRFNVIDYFLRDENRMFKDQLQVQLKSIVPLAGIMTKLNHTIGTYKELSTLYKCLWSFLAIIDLIKAHSMHSLEILHRIVALDRLELRAAVDSIINVVDFEASKREKRIQVCLGVDELVDEKKELVANLLKFCEEVAVEETVRYKDIVAKQFEVHYIPRIGFLSCVHYSSTSELMALRCRKEFDVLLQTENSIYFKTPRMDALDTNAGDIACDLIDVQERVLMSLQNELLKYSENILRLMELCGELDCLIAFANVSNDRGYTRPKFTTSNQEFHIRQAYHPLHAVRFNVVPNDIRFYKVPAERSVKIMLLSGPNSCGKTTYMKTTCLVVYLAHIGCFVPALTASLPIVDAILSRIHSADSISTGLSSFATDIHQINYALAKATERSLIVIDEFGKGTQARDGFLLLKALITYFAVRTNKSPYVMAATHFTRIMNHLQNYTEYILYKTFKVSRDSQYNVVYEFKIVDGIGDESLADKVAAKAGIPPRLIERANEIRNYITSGQPLRPLASRGA